MNTPQSKPKPFYLTSYFFLLIATLLFPFVMPPLATLALKYSAFTPDQQARYMAAVFDLAESAFKWIGTAFVIVRGSISVLKVARHLFPELTSTESTPDDNEKTT